MFRSTIRIACLTLVSLAFVGGPVHSGGKAKDLDKKNNLQNRARWEWILENDKGKQLDFGTFMGYIGGEIKHGNNHIGTFKIVDNNSIRVFITEGKLQGRWELNQTRTRPVTFEGDMVGKEGKRRLRVVIIND